MRDDERAPISLVVVGEALPQVVPLAPDSDLTIGRAVGADVVIDDTSLSRRHARFRLAGGAVEVEDLGSSNGTRVRGSRIAAGTRTRLEIGDSAHLGAVLVVVQRRSAAVVDPELPAVCVTPNDELVARIAAS